IGQPLLIERIAEAFPAWGERLEEGVGGERAECLGPEHGIAQVAEMEDHAVAEADPLPLVERPLLAERGRALVVADRIRHMEDVEPAAPRAVREVDVLPEERGEGGLEATQPVPGGAGTEETAAHREERRVRPGRGRLADLDEAGLPGRRLPALVAAS